MCVDLITIISSAFRFRFLDYICKLLHYYWLLLSMQRKKGWGYESCVVACNVFRFRPRKTNADISFYHCMNDKRTSPNV